MALRPGDSQGDGWGARERDLQDPLCLLLLVLFLQVQEKYRQNLRIVGIVTKINDKNAKAHNTMVLYI